MKRITDLELDSATDWQALVDSILRQINSYRDKFFEANEKYKQIESFNRGIRETEKYINNLERKLQDINQSREKVQYKYGIKYEVSVGMFRKFEVRFDTININESIKLNSIEALTYLIIVETLTYFKSKIELNLIYIIDQIETRTDFVASYVKYFLSVLDAYNKISIYISDRIGVIYSENEHTISSDHFWSLIIIMDSVLEDNGLLKFETKSDEVTFLNFINFTLDFNSVKEEFYRSKERLQNYLDILVELYTTLEENRGERAIVLDDTFIRQIHKEAAYKKYLSLKRELLSEKIFKGEFSSIDKEPNKFNEIVDKRYLKAGITLSLKIGDENVSMSKAGYLLYTLGSAIEDIPNVKLKINRIDIGSIDINSELKSEDDDDETINNLGVFFDGLKEYVETGKNETLNTQVKELENEADQLSGRQSQLENRSKELERSHFTPETLLLTKDELDIEQKRIQLEISKADLEAKKIQNDMAKIQKFKAQIELIGAGIKANKSVTLTIDGVEFINYKAKGDDDMSILRSI